MASYSKRHPTQKKGDCWREVHRNFLLQWFWLFLLQLYQEEMPNLSDLDEDVTKIIFQNNQRKFLKRFTRDNITKMVDALMHIIKGIIDAVYHTYCQMQMDYMPYC